MKMILATMLCVVATSGHAACFGSGSFTTCSDSSGNSYTVNRMGNQTYMNGSNARTGSTWSQQSMDLGNMTMTNGQASNGNSWNSTTMNLGGGMTSIYGQDSQGNSFSTLCGPYGCN